jgi:hypothetical protein
MTRSLETCMPGHGAFLVAVGVAANLLHTPSR